MLLARFMVVAATAAASVVPAAAHAEDGRTALAEGARSALSEAGPVPLAESGRATPDGAARTALSPPPVQDDDLAGDHLTVTVRHAGDGTDGTYLLRCHPGGGSHPDAGAACAALDRVTTWGKDTFGPVPDGSICTMQYGGPATAHVTGTWAGRPVDASYDRSDGCEIGRWDRLVPLLPDLREHGRL